MRTFKRRLSSFVPTEGTKFRNRAEQAEIVISNVWVGQKHPRQFESWCSCNAAVFGRLTAGSLHPEGVRGRSYGAGGRQQLPASFASRGGCRRLCSLLKRRGRFSLAAEESAELIGSDAGHDVGAERGGHEQGCGKSISGKNIRSMWLDWQAELTRLMGGFCRIRIESSTRPSDAPFAELCNDLCCSDYDTRARRICSLVLALLVGPCGTRPRRGSLQRTFGQERRP